MDSPVLGRLLLRSGLRPTQKRIALASLLFDGPDRHVTAEDVMREAKAQGIDISLATVYNTLNQFCAAGLLNRIILEGPRTFFDTNTSDHHHIYNEDEDRLSDVPGDRIRVEGIPPLAKGEQVQSVEVLVRVKSRK